MDWFSTLFDQATLSFLSVFIPTIIIVGFFAYAAYRSHIKHVERIDKIKQGFFLSEDE